MKFDLKYILKIAAILTLAIFVTERLLFNGGFNLPLNELFTIISIHFMYAFVLTALNGYFFYFLDSKFDWKENTKKRLILGASGSVMITMIGLAALRFVTLVVILGKPVESFTSDLNVASY